MGLDLFCQLGSEELVNATRLAAYVDAGYKPRTATVTVQSCPGLATALSCTVDGQGDPVPVSYTTPGDPADPAPWYDPLDPASADFAGLLVTSVEGAETAASGRTVTRLVGDGAALGELSYGPREMVVTALLIGRTCCSLQAGLRWLNGVLRSQCGAGGAELEYLECCPNETQAATVGVGQFLRTMRRVGVTEGITVTDRIGPSCGQCSSGCTYMEVQFTLTAGDPFSYGATIPVTDGTLADGSIVGCIHWDVPERKVLIAPGKYRTVLSDCSGGCGEGDCPHTDPACPPGPLPPRFPAPDPCGCQPLATVGKYAWIPPGVAPAWQQMVPVVSLYAGSEALRSARVVVYSNPAGVPVEELEDCDACAEFTVSYLEPSSTFTVDGRDRRFVVSCPGREPVNGARLITGESGRPFRWPVLDCGGGYTVAVSADERQTAVDASFRIDVVPRTPA